jgi:hypothetical protein
VGLLQVMWGVGIRRGEMRGRRHGCWSQTCNPQDSSAGHIKQCAAWNNIQLTASPTSKPLQCSSHSHTMLLENIILHSCCYYITNDRLTD